MIIFPQKDYPLILELLFIYQFTTQTFETQDMYICVIYYKMFV